MKELYFVIGSYINSKYAIISVDTDKKETLKNINKNLHNIIKNKSFVNL